MGCTSILVPILIDERDYDKDCDRDKDLKRNMTLPEKHSRSGLTLIEVMLALSILGIGLFVLVAGTAQGLAVVRAARLYDHAHGLLGRIEAEHPIRSEDIRPGVERGAFGYEHRDFSWEREIDYVGDEEDRLFVVTTRVIWSRRGRRGFEEVVTYRHLPEEEEE